MRNKAIILSVTSLLFVIPAAFGQTIHQRKVDQQDRIAQGVQKRPVG